MGLVPCRREAGCEDGTWHAAWLAAGPQGLRAWLSHLPCRPEFTGRSCRAPRPCLPHEPDPR